MKTADQINLLRDYLDTLNAQRAATQRAIEDLESKLADLTGELDLREDRQRTYKCNGKVLTL